MSLVATLRRRLLDFLVELSSRRRPRRAVGRISQGGGIGKKKKEKSKSERNGVFRRDQRSIDRSFVRPIATDSPSVKSRTTSSDRSNHRPTGREKSAAAILLSYGLFPRDESEAGSLWVAARTQCGPGELNPGISGLFRELINARQVR